MRPECDGVVTTKGTASLFRAPESECGGREINMNTQPEAEPTDVLGLRLLQMIASLQQDQLKLLELVGRLIKEMEVLEKRVQKLEKAEIRRDVTG